MKKIRICFAIAVLLLAVNALGQISPPASAKISSSGSRDLSFTCPVISVFSQVYPTSDNLFWANLPGYTRMELIDDYSATSTYSSLRFWGANFFSCSAGTTQTFTIRVYEKNIENPNNLGDLYFTGTYTITPLVQIESIPQYYQVDIDLETTISLLEGWISIQRISTGDGCGFAGHVKYTGSGNAATLFEGSYWYQDYQADLLFCLGGAAPVETPISPYAIIIGFVLISAVIFLRTRRYF